VAAQPVRDDDDGHNGEPDNYSGPDLYVYRLGFDHRRLEFGLYPHCTRRDLQRYDGHALCAEIDLGDTGPDSRRIGGGKRPF